MINKTLKRTAVNGNLDPIKKASIRNNLSFLLILSTTVFQLFPQARYAYLFHRQILKSPFSFPN